MLSLLLETKCNVACWRDANGLTPLHSAALLEPKYNLEVIKIIIERCPQSVEVCDSYGKSILHHLINRITNRKDGIELFKCLDIRALRNRQDQQGNTPLHLAVINKDIVMVHLLLNMGVNFTISNKDGFSAATLIKQSKIFNEFEKCIWKKSTLIGVRSTWGIPTTYMKDYVNTMGVIAALLTTITFIAAFTIPGGLDQEKGTPLIVRMAISQISMISNVLAMCLSMMVLFCVLCIMATSDKRKSVVLLDFSILLLLASLYTTILTFMTGVYATTHLVEPKIAIVSLVMCSTVLFFMHKFLVTKFMIPSGRAVLKFAEKALVYVSGLSKKEVDKTETINQFTRVKYI